MSRVATALNTDSLLTSNEVGTLLQVNRRSVNNWVRQGHLRAFRTPGGHRRIKIADLINFLKKQEIPIPDPLRTLTRRRLMIVDDDAAQLRAIARMLKPHAALLDVLLLGNGIDALVEIGGFDPHVVIIDLYMPQLDGIEVCRRLKSLDRTRNVTVIVTSAQLTPNKEQEALEAGASQCIGKPLTVESLLNLLNIDVHETIAAEPKFIL